MANTGVRDEFFGLTIFVRSKLTHVRATEPQDDDEVKEAADRFAVRIQALFQQSFGGRVEVSTTYAVRGSALIGHDGFFKFETLEQFERAQRVFMQHCEDMEEWLKLEWRRQERLRGVDVRITARPGTSTAISEPAPPSAESIADIARVEGGRQTKLLSDMRNRWIAAGLAFGVVSVSAWSNYQFMRNELDLLRERMEQHDDTQARSGSAEASPPPTSVINCAPEQSIRQRRWEKHLN